MKLHKWLLEKMYSHQLYRCADCGVLYYAFNNEVPNASPSGYCVCGKAKELLIEKRNIVSGDLYI